MLEGRSAESSTLADSVGPPAAQGLPEHIGATER